VAPTPIVSNEVKYKPELKVYMVSWGLSEHDDVDHRCTGGRNDAELKFCDSTVFKYWFSIHHAYVHADAAQCCLTEMAKRSKSKE
jgi:hypothetical protein